VSNDGSDDPSVASARARGRIAAARLRVDNARTAVVASRTRYRPIDVAFDLSDRDIATGGAVLAGAIAFRMFLWTLPASLLSVGILGFNADGARSDAGTFGLAKATADSVGDAAAQAQRGRWVLVLTGAVLLVSVSRTMAVTLRTAVALTWQLPVPKRRHYLQTAGLTIVVMAGVLAVIAFCSWLRHQSPGIGIAVIILVVVIWALVWWGVSALLPHPPLPWWGLLPGAALVGIGMELLNLAVVLYLGPRIGSASALYGSLGVAATLLLGAYLLARIMLASAALNATLHARYPQHHPASDEVAES
jgi:uncharacterized BrkB/YihY/UPF0761 family membrane protein